ncbi:hypothetical protein [Salinispora arenicola]|uniref:hypothetical protein n=1 Tax=Salinispora arenicola TaxID=168697 RepID=UPI0004761862|nr:hypothetical protein [Salinispora arenicola]
MKDRKRITHSKGMEAQMRFFVESTRLPPRQRPPLIARAAHAATAAYQRATKAATTNRRQVWQEIYQLQKDVQRLQHEMRLLRKEVRCRPTIADQRRLMEAHLRDQLAAELEEARREGYAKGYVTGVATLTSPGEPISESTADRRTFYWQVYADVMRDLWDLE